MADGITISVLACVALLFGAACWLQCRKGSTSFMDELRVPLVLVPSAVGHRLQLAMRDADAGFLRCTLCGFENFKRFPFCSLCGEAMVQAKQYVYYGQLTSFASINDTADTQYTSRQKRARNRKEWLRKLDVEGKLYWFRQRIEHTTGVPRLAGYTLLFTEDEAILDRRAVSDVEERLNEAEKSDTSPAAEAKARVICDVFPPDSVLQDEERLLSGRPVNQVEEQHQQQQPTGSKPFSKEAILHLLNTQVALVSNVLTGSWLSDPEAFPVYTAADRGYVIQLRDTLRIASANFPTKFAHFVTTTVGLTVPPVRELITLNIRRESLLADSVEALSVIPREHIRSSFRVNFVDERGVDAGGIYREWCVLLNQSLADASTGVFRCVDVQEQIFYLNSNSAHDIGDDHLMYFFATGRQVGRALLGGHVLGFHLALPLLKIVLGLPVSFNDLEYFDPQAYKSMLWILSSDAVDTLDLSFSVIERRGEQMVEVDLIENGRNVSVTNDNKELYLQRRFQYLLFESVSSQLYVFLKGVYEVVPQQLLMLFDPEEFDYVLCGSDEIDVDDWQKNTRHSGNLHADHDVVRWFWEIIREMPNEYRRRLLHFATGSSRVPIEGFSGLTSIDGRLYRFTLKGVPLEDNEYIWGHACFNQLDLPLYATRERLKMMLYATLETDTHGFTTD